MHINHYDVLFYAKHFIEHINLLLTFNFMVCI